MVTRDPGAPFGTPNAVIGRQGRNELTLSFRPDPNLSRLLGFPKKLLETFAQGKMPLKIQKVGVYASRGPGERRGLVRYDPGGRLPRLGCQTMRQGPG